MRPEDKTIKELLEKGYSTLKSDGYNDSEYPEVWRMIAVWFGIGRKSLYLDYEWQRDRYHFYFYKNKKVARANRPKTRGFLDIYHVESYLRGEMPYLPLAKKVAHSVMGKKEYYCTKKREVINTFVGDIDNFSHLVDWYIETDVPLCYAFDEKKTMFIIGVYDKVLDALKVMGYRFHLDDDELVIFDDIDLK